MSADDRTTTAEVKIAALTTGRTMVGRARLCGLLLATSFISSGFAQQSPRQIKAIKEQVLDGNEHVFTVIEDVLVDSRGNLAISQPQDARIRFFSAAGADMGGVGRKGAGPGEYRRLANLGWAGDTLWAYDSSLKRFNTYSADHNQLRVVLVPPKMRVPEALRGAPTFTSAMPFALYRDGTIGARVNWSYSDEPAKEWHDLLVASRFNEQGEISKIIAKVHSPSDAIILRDKEGAEIGMVGVPLVSQPKLAASPNGSRVTIAFANTEGPRAGTVRVLTVDERGVTIFDKYVPFRRDVLTRKAADSIVEERYTNLRKSGKIQLANAFKRQAKLPSMLPPLERVVVGSDGKTWLALKSGGKRYYTVLSASGATHGELVLSNGGHIRAANGTHVWVVESDKDGVPSVVRYKYTIN